MRLGYLSLGSCSLLLICRIRDASLVVDRTSIVKNCELLILPSAQVGAQTEGERHACRASERSAAHRETVHRSAADVFD